MSRTLPVVAALSALSAIVLGAFGAHAISDPQAKRWIETAVLFQLPHAVAVFALLGWRDVRGVRLGAWALLAGSLLFAGSLHALALGLPRGMAALAPVGGVLMMLGWGWIAVVALRGR
ncbi:DUF423 domain-containing protein [Sandaracinobacteroides hominis]|uniref:DUF423 domain-containing protein n=1 Tax=Sandaracinobacteroides hominis TaxID=2780086 RepID=UPI0018F6E475|nr:DUF423 domain-containing protein [Sandaracinobacteroides hominis]